MTDDYAAALAALRRVDQAADPDTARRLIARAIREALPDGAPGFDLLRWVHHLLEHRLVPSSQRARKVPALQTTWTPSIDQAPEDFWRLAAEVFPTLSNPTLAAFVADCLWTHRKEVGYARAAVAQYIRAATAQVEGERTWGQALEYLARAGEISRLLHLDLAPLHAALEDVARRVPQTVGGLCILGELLEVDICHCTPAFEVIAPRLLNLADDRAGQGGAQRLAERHILEVAQRLHRRRGETQRANDLQVRQLESALAEADERKTEGGFIEANAVKQAIELAATLGRADLRLDLLRRLADANCRGMEDMKPIEASVTLTRDEVEAGVAQLLASVPGDDPIGALMALAANLWRSWAEVRAEQAEIESDAPLQAHIPIEWLSGDGRARPEPTDPERREEARLLVAYSEGASLHARILWTYMLHLRERSIWTAENILAAFQHGAMFDDKSRAAIAPGVAAFEEGRYWEAAHVLVPQVERVIRRLAEGEGAQTMVIDQGTGETRWRPLGELLKEAKVVACLDRVNDDLARNLRALFADSYGMNLRNEVAHGALDPERSGAGAGPAFVALLSLLTLARFLPREVDAPTSDGQGGQ